MTLPRMVAQSPAPTMGFWATCRHRTSGDETMPKFIADTDHLMKSRSTVARNYPAAVVIARVAGGWMLFPSRNEWRAWNRQK